MFRYCNPELFLCPTGPHVLAPHATMFVFSAVDCPIWIHSAVYVGGFSNRETKKVELNNTTSYVTISCNGSMVQFNQREQRSFNQHISKEIRLTGVGIKFLLSFVSHNINPFSQASSC